VVVSCWELFFWDVGIWVLYGPPHRVELDQDRSVHTVAGRSMMGLLCGL
jgi:hypothetical protein